MTSFHTLSSLLPPLARKGLNPEKAMFLQVLVSFTPSQGKKSGFLLSPTVSHPSSQMKKLRRKEADRRSVSNTFTTTLSCSRGDANYLSRTAPEGGKAPKPGKENKGVISRRNNTDGRSALCRDSQKNPTVPGTRVEGGRWTPSALGTEPRCQASLCQ